MAKKRTNSADGTAATKPDDGGRYTTHINSKKLGPNTPVRRCKRNADTSDLSNLLKSTTTPSNKKASRTFDRATNTDKNPKTSNVATSTSTHEDNYEDGVNDLCTIFAAKVKVNDDDLSAVPAVGTPDRVSPMPRAGRFTALVENKRKKTTNTAVVGPVRRCTRNT